MCRIKKVAFVLKKKFIRLSENCHFKQLPSQSLLIRLPNALSSFHDHGISITEQFCRNQLFRLVFAFILCFLFLFSNSGDSNIISAAPILKIISLLFVMSCIVFPGMRVSKGSLCATDRLSFHCLTGQQRP